jgi:hypothetical protein
VRCDADRPVNGFILYLVARGHLGFGHVLLVDCAIAPNARAVLMPDVVAHGWLLVAANEDVA